jgi:hypothetical protein
MVKPKKLLELKSPYAQFMQQVNNGFKLKREIATSPEEVAKVILKAVTAENPAPRYLVGNDAVAWMEARRKMSDAEFETFIKQDILK